MGRMLLTTAPYKRAPQTGPHLECDVLAGIVFGVQTETIENAGTKDLPVLALASTDLHEFTD